MRQNNGETIVGLLVARVLSSNKSLALALLSDRSSSLNDKASTERSKTRCHYMNTNSPLLMEAEGSFLGEQGELWVSSIG